MNCIFVDCNKIEIGNNVLIASNVQIYTATHPVELSDRLTPDWDPDSGEYFCIGDNPGNSEDSRSANIGPVEEKDIIGKAWFHTSCEEAGMGLVK